MIRQFPSMALFAVFGALAGCTKSGVADSAQLTIVPGVGISNMVEIGMSLDEMKSHMGDMRVTVDDDMKPKWFHAEIHSLGVSFGNVYSGDTTPYYGHIEFNVVPETNQNSFHGSLPNGISFAASGGVSRAEILAHFGSPIKSLTSIYEADLVRCLIEGTSVAVVTKEDETLYYPAEGIIFNLRSGVVVNVSIQLKQVKPPAAAASGAHR